MLLEHDVIDMVDTKPDAIREIREGRCRIAPPLKDSMDELEPAFFPPTCSMVQGEWAQLEPGSYRPNLNELASLEETGPSPAPSRGPPPLTDFFQ